MGWLAIPGGSRHRGSHWKPWPGKCSARSTFPVLQTKVLVVFAVWLYLAVKSTPSGSGVKITWRAFRDCQIMIGWQYYCQDEVFARLTADRFQQFWYIKRYLEADRSTTKQHTRPRQRQDVSTTIKARSDHHIPKRNREQILPWSFSRSWVCRIG